MKESADITIENSDGIPKMRRQVGDSSEIAVLISPGFGAGWSTWSPEDSLVLLFHKDIVEFILKNPVETCVDAEAWDREVAGLVHAITGDDCAYMGGAEQLVVAWLPEGTPFIVTEYDGAEGLRSLSSYDWHKA
jgi:hypothetical protein